MLEGVFGALHAAAATVYHDILALEVDAKRWEMNNPMLKTFLEEGLATANKFFEGLGVPAPTLEFVESGLIASLKNMAAGDASVNSHATSDATPLPVSKEESAKAPAPAPAPAPVEEPVPTLSSIPIPGDTGPIQNTGST